MQLVEQRYARDCGIAVAAILSGRPYEAVRESARPAGLLCHSGTSIDRLVAILERTTRRRWRAYPPDEFGPLAEHAAVIRSPRPVALLIFEPGPGVDNSHWIAVANGRIYDPEEERVWRLGSYPKAGWVLSRIITVVR